jgi:hypothetical protein
MGEEMKGRVARVKLDPAQLLLLKDGYTLSVRLPKDVALLQISTKDGDIFAKFERFFDRFFKIWDDFFEQIPPVK